MNAPRLRPAVARALRSGRAPRVTVFRPGALGDTVLTLPALRLMRRACPAAVLTLVGSRWAEGLRPLLDLPLRVVRFGSPQLTLLFLPGAGSDPTGLAAEADLVIIYGRSEGDELAGNAARLCRGAVLSWPVEPEAGTHAALHFARAVAELDAGELPLPALGVPPEARAWAAQWLADRLPGPSPIAVHPGSGSANKCWPAARFAALIERISGSVLVLRGPADGAPCKELARRLGGRGNIAEAVAPGVPQLAGLIGACRAFIGNDSGVSHLAAALGVPTVAVYGRTDPAVWSPLGPAVRAVGDGTGWPEVPDVLAALRELGGARGPGPA